MKKERYYVIADTHFYHEKMTEYCGREPGWEEAIGKNLAGLAPDVILIHLGDIVWYRAQEAHDKYIAPLKCKKILVRGNHDKQTNTWYLRNGWDFVCTSYTDRLYGHDLLFSHKPMPDTGYDFNIHGHLHNLGHHDGESQLVRNEKQILYATEDYNNMPMSVNDLIQAKKGYTGLFHGKTREELEFPHPILKDFTSEQFKEHLEGDPGFECDHCQRGGQQFHWTHPCEKCGRVGGKKI